MYNIFLKEERQEKLREYMRIAIKALGQGVVAQAELDAHFFRQIRQQAFKNSLLEEDQSFTTFLKLLVTACLRQYNFNEPRIEIKWSVLKAGTAAHVYKNNSIWCVEVDDRYIIDDLRLTCIVAHELAHVVLGSKGILLTPVQRNEELTDATAALAGFGALLQKASMVTSTRFDQALQKTIHTTHQMGYLKANDFSFLRHKRIYLKTLRKAHRLSRINYETEPFFYCYLCQQPIRSPQKSGFFNLKCPTCLIPQTIHTVSNYSNNKFIFWLFESHIKSPILRFVDRVRGFHISFPQHSSAYTGTNSNRSLVNSRNIGFVTVWALLLLCTAGTLELIHINAQDKKNKEILRLEKRGLSEDIARQVVTNSDMVLPTLEKFLPLSGIYQYGDTFRSGLSAPFKVANGPYTSSLIKLTSIGDTTETISIFIRPNEDVEVPVPVGAYYCTIAYGNHWYGDAILFGPTTTYTSLVEILYFMNDGYSVTGNKLSLVKTTSGNLAEKNIRPSDF
jgi:hypothetical protein